MVAGGEALEEVEPGRKGTGNTSSQVANKMSVTSSSVCLEEVKNFKGGKKRELK